GVTVQGYGSLTQIWGSTIANAGTIVANTEGQTFTINPDTFTNIGTLGVTAGTMDVSSATFTQAGMIGVANGSTFNRAAGFTNTGTLSGGGTIVVGTGAAALINQGNINPGGTGVTGTLAISGDVQLSTGSILNMELGGTGAGQFDKLAVSGAVSGVGGSFGGLTVARNNGYTYVNANGDTFPLLTAASGANSATFVPPSPLARANLTTAYAASSFALGVTPMVLTVSADALSKVYGAVDPTLTYIATGFDASTLDTPSTALSGLLGRAAGANVGAYAINQGALISPLGYAISVTPGSNLSITPASLTVTANSATKTYDGGLTAATTAMVSSGTLFGSDALSGGTFAYTDKNVGSGNKTVTATGVTAGNGVNNGNYNVSYVDNTTSTINAYAVSLTGSRAYDGTVNVAAGVLTLGALVGSETLTLSGSGTVVNKNVGTAKALAVGTLALGSGTGLASNYTFTGGTRSVDFTAAALNVTANIVSKTYDGTLTATGTGTLGAIAGAGDSVLGAGSQAFLDKNAGVGNKAVRASGVTIQDAGSVDVSGNYAITYIDNAVSTINKASLSAIATAVTKTYDGTLTATPTLSITTGLVGSETVTATGTASFNTKDVLTASLVTVNSNALA
ncbi:MAG TPA: YDG domain-containing protein, partial [Glaciihabitans sp.]|nr:YDG domain-containing protein [Glaciihabitans sp.]